MTKLQFFKELGNIDKQIIEEVSTVPYKKHRNPVYVVAVVACVLIVFGVFVSYKISHENIKHNPADNLITQNTATEPTPTIITFEQLLDRAKINKIPPLYSTSKLWMDLKPVSEKKWEKRYGLDNFVKLHEREYKFSYSYKKKKVWCGLLSLKLSKKKVVDMKVHEKNMLYNPYTNLKTTFIGDYEVAICQKGISNWGAIIYGDNDIIYVFERSTERTKKQFLKLLLEILEY